MDMTDSAAGVPRHVADLGTILELCEAVSATNDLADAFSRIMRVLSAERKFQRACLLVLDETTGRLAPVVSSGMTSDESDKGRYFPGEGVTGNVLATGRARIIPDTRQEPDFLNRTGRLADDGLAPISFMCVPLRVEGKVVGVAWADKVFPGDDELKVDHAVLEILSAILSQCMRLDRMVTREKQEMLVQSNAERSQAREKYQFDNIIGDAPAMQDVFATVGQVANSRATVLLLGETGTGNFGACFIFARKWIRAP